MGKVGQKGLRYGLFETALGVCGLAWGEAGVRAFLLPEASASRMRARLESRHDELEESEPDSKIAKIIEGVQRHLSGEPADFRSVRLDFRGVTPFRRRVFEALRQTPAGETISYGELAARAGAAGGAQAVGQAMAHNPYPLLVPCHRVLAAGGKPGGFSSPGGLTTKGKLLALEGVTLAEPHAASKTMGSAKAIRA